MVTRGRSATGAFYPDSLTENHKVPVAVGDQRTKVDRQTDRKTDRKTDRQEDTQWAETDREKPSFGT